MFEQLIERILSSPACGSLAVILFVVLFVVVLEALQQRGEEDKG